MFMQAGPKADQMGGREAASSTEGGALQAGQPQPKRICSGDALTEQERHDRTCNGHVHRHGDIEQEPHHQRGNDPQQKRSERVARTETEGGQALEGTVPPQGQQGRVPAEPATNEGMRRSPSTAVEAKRPRSKRRRGGWPARGSSARQARHQRVVCPRTTRIFDQAPKGKGAWRFRSSPATSSRRVMPCPLGRWVAVGLRSTRRPGWRAGSVQGDACR